MIKDLLRQITQEKIALVAADLDEVESDLFALFVPEEYDGLGKDVLDLCIVVEELSKACAGAALTYTASALGTYPISHFQYQERPELFGKGS